MIDFIVRVGAHIPTWLMLVAWLLFAAAYAARFAYAGRYQRAAFSRWQFLSVAIIGATKIIFYAAVWSVENDPAALLLLRPMSRVIDLSLPLVFVWHAPPMRDGIGLLWKLVKSLR